MNAMSLYLTAAAERRLRAYRALARPGRPAGFLLGHVRGGQFFVEDALAAPAGDWASLRAYEKLDGIEPGRIVGFFIFSKSPAERRKIGTPHACGKALLIAASDKGGGLAGEGFRIEFEGRFAFQPLPVIREKETAP